FDRLDDVARGREAAKVHVVALGAVDGEERTGELGRREEHADRGYVVDGRGLAQRTTERTEAPQAANAPCKLFVLAPERAAIELRPAHFTSRTCGERRWCPCRVRCRPRSDP